MLRNYYNTFPELFTFNIDNLKNNNHNHGNHPNRYNKNIKDLSNKDIKDLKYIEKSINDILKCIKNPTNFHNYNSGITNSGKTKITTSTINDFQYDLCINHKMSIVAKNILRQYDIAVFQKRKYCGLKTISLIKIDGFLYNYNKVLNNSNIDNNPDPNQTNQYDKDLDRKEENIHSSKPINIKYPEKMKPNEINEFLQEKQLSHTQQTEQHLGYKSRYSKNP